MKAYIKIFSAALLASFLCGCFGPVLQMGDRIVPVRNCNGVPVVSARNSIYKEIHYSTFGFDWNENDGFIIPVRQNSLNHAFWASKLTQAKKLYSVVCIAAKQRHYIQKADKNKLQQYLEHSCRQVPGSRIQRIALKIEQCSFKGQPAVYVYLETFEKGRDLYSRAESYYFFDPLQPDTLIYHVCWSERGRKTDWKSPQAETQGRRFFKNFKLLPAKK